MCLDCISNKRPYVTNISGTMSLGVTLDLATLSRVLNNCYYDRNKHNSLRLHLKSPRVSCLIFNSGKVIVAGAKTTIDFHKACRRLARMIQRTGRSVKLNSIEIRNFAGALDVQTQVNLEGLARKDCNAEFTPEIFPGLVYRVGMTNPCITVFRTGKLIITGNKTEEELCSAFNRFAPTLSEFIVCIK